jgi:tetratricopeptide (TPR) repeat protein
MRRAMLAGGLWLLALPVPLAAQTAPPQDDTIVVQGRLEKLSRWREAETDHVVVTSDGSEAELRRIAHNLERLHFLLSVLLGRVDQPDETRKLRVTLVGDSREFDAMGLRNLRFTPGPWRSGFEVQGYYDPREDGPVLAATRYDTRVQLERGASLAGLLPDLIRATSGGVPDPTANDAGLSSHLAGPIGTGAGFAKKDDPFAVAVNEVSVPVGAEGRIYAAFARNWLLTHFPNAYPRWYVDGFGELFSTIEVKGDGQISYGRAPEGYGRVLNSVHGAPVKDVLTGTYPVKSSADSRWTPFHAWGLAHMLFFDEARRPQLRAYLAGIAAGDAPARAAAALGDLDQLQRDLAAWDNKKMPYEQMTYPAERVAEPMVRQLTEGEATFVKGRLELGSRIALPPAARDAWLRGLRRDAARYPANLQAQLLLAEAECRSGNAPECLTAADRALAADPNSSDARAWRGSALLAQALAAPAAERRAKLKAARAEIARANRADPDNPLPLLAYYRSFAEAGEAPPDIAIEGLMKVVDTVPAAPGPRLLLGEALVRRGNSAAARRALLPVANGAYEAPERVRAQKLLEGGRTG